MLPATPKTTLGTPSLLSIAPRLGCRTCPHEQLTKSNAMAALRHDLGVAAGSCPGDFINITNALPDGRASTDGRRHP